MYGQFQHIYTDTCCLVHVPVPASAHDILTHSDALQLLQVLLNSYIKSDRDLNNILDIVWICTKYIQNVNALPINTYNVIFASSDRISSFRSLPSLPPYLFLASSS